MTKINLSFAHPYYNRVAAPKATPPRTISIAVTAAPGCKVVAEPVEVPVVEPVALEPVPVAPEVVVLVVKLRTEAALASTLL